METVISARSTFAMKWLFPAAWFGFLIFFIAVALQQGIAAETPIFLAVPVVMGVFGFFFFKVLLWDLADRVVDHGTHLVVTRGRVTESIPLENIMNVSATPLMKPPRITLRLVNAGALGGHVSFASKSSPLSLGLSMRNETAEQLMERAYAARAQRGG